MIVLQMVLAALIEWLTHEPHDVIAFIREENGALRRNWAGGDCG